MSWPERSQLALREDFVLRVLEPGSNRSELCRECGISRKAGYKWKERLQAQGVARLADLSRQPRCSPLRASGEAALGRARALAEWREDTTKWVTTQARGVAPGGRMVVVVGDGYVGGKLVDALHPTVEAMELAGLRQIARASADRLDHAREVIRIEHIVMAEKV